MLLAMVGALPVVAHKGREGPALVMVPAVAAMAGMFPHQQPFPGYRTDVVAVLANVVYGDTYVQQVRGGWVVNVLVKTRLGHLISSSL